LIAGSDQVNILDRMIGAFAPGLALQRARNRTALAAVMRYDAATTGNRANSWKPVRSDADAAGAQRERLAAVARDMVRNTPFAVRAQQVIASNVVGNGIIPKIVTKDDAVRESVLRVIEQHFDTSDIDADGRTNLYGLQRLATNTVVESGEVLIRRRRRFASDGFALPFQLQVLEPDYLDNTKMETRADGSKIDHGIEYDAIGRRVAYWLWSEHPGAGWQKSMRFESRRISASEVLHVYRQDRPGQNRGVSWFAPIALTLQDLADHQDAQLMRQKIAACFAAFRVTVDGEPTGTDVADLSGGLIPGRIQNLSPGEDIRFAVPPGVEGYDEFTRSVLRSVAAGMGITYEALSGDLSNVNFSSGRMGRLEMDRNVSAWQMLMLIPQMLQPIGAWAVEGWRLIQQDAVADVKLDWVPPNRPLIDPNREITALRDKVKAGFASRSSVIRELGYDPERVMEEIAADNASADVIGAAFDSDGRNTGAGAAQPNNGVIDVQQ
jgi:lambda family phage portal protein